MFYAHQFGFWNNHSMSHSIVIFVERVSKALDTYKYDIKTSFDTVANNIFLQKLKLYGIREDIYKWFRSYLTEISQYSVEYHNYKYEKK